MANRNAAEIKDRRFASPFDDDEAILIVHDDSEMRGFLENALRKDCARAVSAGNASEARTLAKRTRFDILIADIHLAGPTSGLELAREFQDGGYDVGIIFVTDEADITASIGALQDHSADLLRTPVHVAQLLAVIKRSRERRKAERENYLLQRDHRPAVERMIGESEPIKEVWRIIRRIAPMPATVLIKGETGTGKELAARALHDLSGRRGSYVPVNCAAISPDLIEDELFGHLKGAFTGAHQARQGLFSHADGGTLFLDEIGEMPLGMQAKLLRVLEQRTYRPVGSNREVPTNARVITATNGDLSAQVLAGRFRKDLFYRINVIAVNLPPLRERKSDIERLARLYLDLMSREVGVPTPELDAWNLEQMMQYDWPGNIRELRNVIERSILLGRPVSHFISAADLVEPVREVPTSNSMSLERMEQSQILRALHVAHGNKTAAARTLGVSRKTVERKLKRMR